MDELFYSVWLSLVKGLSYQSFTRLYERLKSFRAVFDSDKTTLEHIGGLSKNEIEGLINKNTDKTEKILDDCYKHNISVLSCVDNNYPKLLRQISNPPLLLYIKGASVDFNECVNLAVVGTRRPSAYGNKMSFNLGYDLAKEGITIVSGMARGIDSQAQRGALKAGAATVAVLGNGCDVVYPPENKELKSIIENNGCVISEYPPGTKAYAGNFPQRNRIMSGMSLGVVVVEGEASSGTLITSRLALEQGRDVYCVPGNVDNPLSFVPNTLIKDGAPLVTDAKDIIVELTDSYPELMLSKILTDEVSESPACSDLPEEQKKILAALSKSTPKHIDEICFESNLDIATVSQNIMMLEINRLVASMPGRYYLLK